jgi:hypothetical protein
MMSHQDLLAYWPRQEDVVACVKTDAEAASEAVSLAVHQPLQFERRVIGGQSDTLLPCDERELLKLFLEPNLSEGRVIFPIVGSSGTGKSHVVRWMDAQLRRMDDHATRVVIRIPKGTSLKGVLGILLRDLPGSEYDQYRQELTRAQEALDPNEAAGLLCEMLAHTISEIGVAARARLLENPGDKGAQERDAYCQTTMLPALLRNQLLRDQHFIRSRTGGDGVITRLVEQLTEGRPAGTDDDRQHLFRPQDLEFDQIERDGLGLAEKRAVGQLDREDRRQIAAGILNTALDDAKQRLLRLDPTISDLFDAVRQQFLAQKKELVLLVEDFAAVSGMQKQLLQVIIKEAFRDGRQVLCTMRTVIAYTTGYMDTATVLTRANVEYRIPDEPRTDEELFSRIERLVGAYLNAARQGQTALEQAYHTHRQQADGSGVWIPKFVANVEQEARATLEDFGTSVDQYELFPFNRDAIRELSREGSVRAGQPVYNPRFVIQNVINRVLSHRDLFEAGQFPPASFGGRGQTLPSRVVEEVKVRVPVREMDRYLRFLTYWGGVPTTVTDIVAIEPRVFLAFGLDKALFNSLAEKVPSPTHATKTESKSQKPEPAPIEHRSDRDPQELKWEAALEKWRAGETLPQAEANQLRKWIADALKAFIDWDWDLHRPLKDVGINNFFADIYIPRAQGNQGRTADEEKTMLSVCLDADLLDAGTSASVQSALMAIIRFQGIHQTSWDYEEADADLPRYVAFLESIADRARTFVLRRYFKAAWEPIPALVQGLLIGARALGVEAATKDRSPSSLIQSLFTVPEATLAAQPTTTVPDADSTRWDEFTDAVRRCRRIGDKEARDQSSWQGHLLNLIGARQGQADIVHAIDALRLKAVVEETIINWEFGATLPNPAGVIEFSSFRTMYSELKRLSSAIPKAQQRLVSWRSEMLAWLGESFDKETFVRELKETIEAARAAGVAGGLDANGLIRLLEEFRTAKVKTALDDVEKLEGSTSRGLVLTVLGRGHEPVARFCEAFQQRITSFVGAVEDNLASEAIRYGEDPVAEALASLKAELQDLSTVLEGVESL